MTKILYVTCAENGLRGLSHLVRERRDISAVVTIGADVAKKAQVSGYVNVAAYASQVGIRCIELSTYNLSRADLGGLDFDILVVNGWNRLISQDVLGLAKLGAIGLHAGHPPIGLGRAPLVWNILLGQSDIEVYSFRLTANADDGNIFARRTIEITRQDTVEMLYHKVAFWGGHLIDEAIEKLSRGESGQQQDTASAVIYKKRSPDDGLVDFFQTEDQIYDFVRAQSAPYPGAFSFLGDVRWTFDHVVPFDRFSFRELKREPGKIVAALPMGLVVATGRAPVWIVRARLSDGSSVPGPMKWMESFVHRRFGQ